MGFFDRPVENSFDRLFDFNRDGSLDSVEQGFQLDFITEDIERDNEYDDDKSDDYSDLDWDELEDMDEDERREALEEAGYDPDDFDDDFCLRGRKLWLNYCFSRFTLYLR